jgi:deoxyribodipyrimidine photo-lyase
MKNINSYRVFKHNTHEVNAHGEFVLYWMHSNRRFYYNYALEYAVAMANALDKPLVILEGLNVDYPWASDRFHRFIIDGMIEKAQLAVNARISYYTYLEPAVGSGKGLIDALAQQACAIVSDEYPVFIMQTFNERLGKRLPIPYITIDSNGLIPLGLTEKAPYAAYLFRKIVQKQFLTCWELPPQEFPLSALKHTQYRIPSAIRERWPELRSATEPLNEQLATYPINHAVGLLPLKGDRATGLERLTYFSQHRLARYGSDRNDPDAEASSGMSPYLHFGVISEVEVIAEALRQQPEGWTTDTLTDKKGQSEGFYGGHDYVEKFLDEVITWRGVGFHFAHHTRDFDQFTSLPAWAKTTLLEHQSDPRPTLYTLEQLEQAQTADPIWNAAQRQLVREGIIHNYLRMVWGKKVLEWTPDPETALAYLIELNNKYALDGRDPNSYSGIFWCLGRFDRPWFERPIFGTIRFMSSESARKKLKMTNYLRTYAE